MERLRKGDRVKIIDLPGRWRITQRDPPWYWVEGLDSDAKLFASLSPDGIVGFRQRDIISDTTDHERLF